MAAQMNVMVFKNRTDSTYNAIFTGTIAVCLLATIPTLNTDMSFWGQLVLVAINGATIGLLGWAWLGMRYELTTNELRVFSGPFRKKIALSRVKLAQVGETMWVGNHRYGTAKGGIIIRFDGYDELYITPETNEQFMEALLERLPELEVRHKDAAP